MSGSQIFPQYVLGSGWYVQSGKSVWHKEDPKHNEQLALWCQWSMKQAHPLYPHNGVFFSCLLTIQCVSQLFVFHLFIHTVTLMLVLVFHHERTLSPPISQIELATCHTLLRPQCNIFTTCLTCRRLESSVKINN